MGLLNILSPVFGAVDGAVAPVLPAAARMALWAAFLAVGTMLLYKVLSPQERIGKAKREAREARRKLNSFDGEFADAGPLIRDQFVTAFKHIGLVVPGTIIAILPLLCFLVWADNYFGHELPADGVTPKVSTVPATANGVRAHWDASSHPPAVSVQGEGGETRSYPMNAPVPVLTKYSAWNWLVGNPLGYLPDDSPLRAVRIELPEREYIHFGPNWMHGWLAVFIPVMFIVSLLMFKWAKIE
ncbi:hypothetical protein [Salinisphaera sp.]|uniref:hypothetical protein n=1 Tax=Salinisphaera sp. TaxID=1914330 RepID=UPI002D7891DF|nr:hypothetical protein [Salinisphaera sp.]HET7314307.1 hypothetical protein [Salinisphaera sp.]